MRYITFRVPLIDTGDTTEQKRRKMLEELDELLAEFSVAPVDKHKAMSEFYDVAQVMVGYLLTIASDIYPNGDPLHEIQTDVMYHNCIHMDKLIGYAKERGWTVL